MELINNRYFINNIIEENDDSITYEVRDLIRNNEKKFLKLYKETPNTSKYVKYLTQNFIKYSTITHPNIIRSYSFDIVKTIDNKDSKKLLYFYTTEMKKGFKLIGTIDRFTEKEVVDIIYQICDVLYHLHLQGITYVFLNQDNIFVNKYKDGVKIKLQDIISVKERIISRTFDYNDRMFIAPEFTFNKEKIDKRIDIFSIGILFYSLLKGVNKTEFNYQSILEEIKNSDNDYFKIIKKCISRNVSKRYDNIYQLVNDLNVITGRQFEFDFTNRNLIFKTPIVGRDKEIREVLDIDNQFNTGNYKMKLVLVKGECGIGKTRFLNEIGFRLRMNNRILFKVMVDVSNSVSSSPIQMILKQMIKNADISLIEKYGAELVKIIPEIRFIKDIKPSSVLTADKEKLRLYDRITNFILDYINKTPTYIMIDDLHNAELETFKILDFIIKNSNSVPLLLIVTYDEEKVKYMPEIKEIINEWKKLDKVKELELLKLSLQETAELLSNILNIDYRPINFTAKIMEETSGNPRYIEEVLKKLYVAKELYLNKKGIWKLKIENIDRLLIPGNIDEAIKEQIELLDRDLYNIIKIISIFNSPVSQKIIEKMVRISEEKLLSLIEKLVSMKLLDKRLEDWGYTYTFYNRNVKVYIYNSIDKDERNRLHKQASEILEDIYKKQDRVNFDELIFHLTLSGETDKAIDYAITFAQKMQRLLANSRAMLLWEKAYKLLEKKPDDIRKLKVLISMGKLYAYQGENNKAIDMYKKALKGAMKTDNKQLIIRCKINMANIFCLRNDLDTCRRLAIEAYLEAKSIDSIESVLDALILLNKINIWKGKYYLVLRLSKKYLELALNEKLYKYAGSIYNHMGLVYMFTEKINLAKECFEKSIELFQKANEFVESTRPINNIGIIYADYFDETDKAMKYMKEGIEISQKYNFVQSEVILLNNIGELYLSINEYEKAKEVVERAVKLSKELEYKDMYFVAMKNLAAIYLHTGEFDKCFDCYYILQEKFKESNISKVNVTEYYNFLSEFYYKFGKWDEAIEFCDKTIENSTKFDIKYKLNAISLKALIKYYKTGILDKKEINKIRDEFRVRNTGRRDFLLRVAYVAIQNGDIDYALELLEEDAEIAEKVSTIYLDIVRKMLIICIEDWGIQRLLEVLKLVRDNRFLELELFIYYMLGEKFFRKQEYYKAANYYLMVLDLLKRLSKKIPDENFRLAYFSSHGKRKIIQKVSMIINILLKDKDELLTKKANEILEKLKYSDMKDIDLLISLFNKINKTTEGNSKETKEYLNILQIARLIEKFNDDYKNNLRRLIRFAVDQSLASRGFIFVNSESTNELEIIASTVDNVDQAELQKIKFIVKQKQRAFILKNVFKEIKNETERLLFGDIKSMICIPIFRARKESLLNKVERRKIKRFSNDKIIGYFYLDSDIIFNRFDQTTFELMKMLSYIAYLNIENYYLKISSSTDKLTGIYNRKYFDFLFDEILRFSKINNYSFSVIMADIDKFKNVNDIFGHQKGDEILSRVAQIIQNNIRHTDIVGRYGGEEFIIILHDTEGNEGLKVAEKIRKEVESANLISKDYPVTISLGVSNYPQHGQFKDELIENADKALYHAKNTGRNKAVLWDNSIRDKAVRFDKLAGIVTGNTVQDQRIVSLMIDVLNLLKLDIKVECKIFEILSRLIEVMEVQQAILFTIEEDLSINKIYAKKRKQQKWHNCPRYNKNIIEKVLHNRKGEFLIDWEDIGKIDPATGKPDWQSVIVAPSIINGRLKGILYLSVPIKEKEFDYNSYNFICKIADIIAAII
ncbi:diguanylate cyclase (GGDEF) domain-containing protein [Caloranaerobacter azorensis DSM 13643]|uniref:Diguanylate cyclase (GGDEF) domain-containing protein n=1 Tax=Caloranaerobacter azorensis DSM 13643 TaxID=1121264 RepID=A0A1M5SQP9_9FIRM|nr:diguanylate cyclase [Caloranaerobacter azorensis]SHH40303.1 diguanylate cyclase (GGDEF) domain-containing protein [Caloranaerobacter azorensis DSM 13643]